MSAIVFKMSTIVAVLKTLPVAVYLGAGLLLSLAVNLHQYGDAQAAEAECRAKAAEQALESRAQADKARAEQQAKIDQASVDESDEQSETLAAIAAGVKRTHYQLSQASRANPSPSVCRVSPDRVRVVNAALSTTRTSRPAL